MWYTVNQADTTHYSDADGMPILAGPYNKPVCVVQPTKLKPNTIQVEYYQKITLGSNYQIEIPKYNKTNQIHIWPSQLTHEVKITILVTSKETFSTVIGNP